VRLHLPAFRALVGCRKARGGPVGVVEIPLKLFGLPGLSARPVEEGVDRNAVEPREQLRVSPKRIGVFEGPNEHVLRQVFGIVMASGQVQREVVDAPLVGGDRVVEGRSAGLLHRMRRGRGHALGRNGESGSRRSGEGGARPALPRSFPPSDTGRRERVYGDAAPFDEENEKGGRAENQREERRARSFEEGDGDGCPKYCPK
jgi:hypothetical protein